MKPLTPAQRCMLRVIDDFLSPGDGWAEITLQFACRRWVPGGLEAAIVQRVSNALFRKGLIRDPGFGPELTDAAIAVLAVGRTEWRDDGAVSR